MPTHSDTIIDQFTKQAMPFSTAPGIKDAQALRLIVDFSGAGADDTVLDVACGPGLVVCAFARVVRQATGIDLTPAMIERARAVQAEQGVSNVTWQVGDVLPLPFADASFSIVTSRFAFHHLPDPLAVLGEMKRVCTPGGKVMLVDLTASPDPEKAAAFHRMEVLRDPSHVRALTLAELQDLFACSALPSAASGLLSPRGRPGRCAGAIVSRPRPCWHHPRDVRARRGGRWHGAGDSPRRTGDSVRLFGRGPGCRQTDCVGSYAAAVTMRAVVDLNTGVPEAGSIRRGIKTFASG